MKILVTGSQGLVGSRFVELHKNTYELLCPSFKELDLTQDGDVIDYIARISPDVIVNFAAQTDVKAAQAEAGNFLGITWKTNYGIPYLLTQIANQRNIKLVQISTDLVFSGKTNSDEKYTENENLILQQAKKISHYGNSKLAAERYVIDKCKNYALIRIAYPFRSGYQKTDFVRNFVKLYDSNSLYPVFYDNSITPTYIDSFCEVLDVILSKKLNGIFHACSTNSTSHYEVAKYILEKTNRDSNKLVKTSMKDFVLNNPQIPRPLYTAMDTTETQIKTGVTFKTWQQYIDEMLNYTCDF